MLDESVVKKCWRSVLERCREVLERRVLLGSVVEHCFKEVLECWRRFLERSVVEECWRRVL